MNVLMEFFICFMMLRTLQLGYGSFLYFYFLSLFTLSLSSIVIRC